jgi:hypothetical protein
VADATTGVEGATVGELETVKATTTAVAMAAALTTPAVTASRRSRRGGRSVTER